MCRQILKIMLRDLEENKMVLYFEKEDFLLLPDAYDFAIQDAIRIIHNRTGEVYFNPDLCCSLPEDSRRREAIEDLSNILYRSRKKNFIKSI